MRDVNGREVRPGDVVRVFHYVDRRTRRRCYMYFLVVKHSGKLCVVNIADIWKSGSLDAAHKTTIQDLQVEIIDGTSRRTEHGDGLETWYERPKTIIGTRCLEREERRG